MSGTDDVGIVLIGRNEGERLVRCLASVQGFGRVVYVDSGSTDGSVAAAEAAGATVVALDMTQPFTAARARNAGLAALPEDVAFIQFVDGDCEVRGGWIETAAAYLSAHPDVDVVCGRRRERSPETSIYNALCDAEWDTPVGEARSCGGDAMMRASVLRAVGGYRGDLIAGEEPELCVRIRRAGGRVMRLDAEMTWHDAAITRFSQWRRRAKRAGHAFAEGAHLHGAPPERHYAAEARRALIWGAALPAVLIAAALAWPPAALLFAVYPAQVARLALKAGGGRFAWTQAFFLTLGKFPEAEGAIAFQTNRMLRRRGDLIEYK